MSSDHGFRAGDIVLVDFDPVRGTEQAGVRPALIISVDALNTRSRRVLVCPITGNMTRWISKLALPNGLKTSGMVLTDQIRAIDVGARVLRRVERVDPAFLAQVRGLAGRWIGLELAEG